MKDLPTPGTGPLYASSGDAAGYRVASLKPELASVALVFSVRHPFEIGGSIVRLDPVDVVDLMNVTRRRPEERYCYESVHSLGYRFRPSTTMETDDEVAATWRSGQDEADARATPIANSPDSAKVAHLVPALETNDRAPCLTVSAGHKQRPRLRVLLVFIRSIVPTVWVRIVGHRGSFLGVMRAAVNAARPLHCIRKEVPS